MVGGRPGEEGRGDEGQPAGDADAEFTARTPSKRSPPSRRPASACPRCRGACRSRFPGPPCRPGAGCGGGRARRPRRPPKGRGGRRGGRRKAPPTLPPPPRRGPPPPPPPPSPPAAAKKSAAQLAPTRFAPRLDAKKSTTKLNNVSTARIARVSHPTFWKPSAHAATSNPTKTSGAPGIAGITVPTIPATTS